MRSCTASTGNHRRSFGEYVAGRVHIAVMQRVAAAVGDAGVHPGDLESGLGSVGAVTFCLAGEVSLGAGEQGIAARAELARELALGDPAITWHAARDAVAETLSALALLAGSLGKIAFDVMLMSATEFGEAAEPLGIAPLPRGEDG